MTDFENPTFDPDGPGIDDDENFDFPDAIMDPPLQELNTSGDRIQSRKENPQKLTQLSSEPVG